MYCKLSKESIIDLQLIHPSLARSEADCPACNQPFVDHHNGSSKLVVLKGYIRITLVSDLFRLQE